MTKRARHLAAAAALALATTGMAATGSAQPTGALGSTSTQASPTINAPRWYLSGQWRNYQLGVDQHTDGTLTVQAWSFEHDGRPPVLEYVAKGVPQWACIIVYDGRPGEYPARFTWHSNLAMDHENGSPLEPCNWFNLGPGIRPDRVWADQRGVVPCNIYGEAIGLERGTINWGANATQHPGAWCGAVPTTVYLF